jgi:hypothetical protein
MRYDCAAMPSPDFLDILAIILGVLYTLRKLDVAGRQAAHFPHVQPHEFEAWKSKQVAAYSLGSAACFLKIVVDFAFVGLVARHLEPTLVRLTGVSIDVAWLAALIVVFVRSAGARRLAARLGIRLGPRVQAAARD